MVYNAIEMSEFGNDLTEQWGNKFYWMLLYCWKNQATADWLMLSSKNQGETQAQSYL